VRAAWGRFHQSQRLNELQVEDGVTSFYPAQRAEHFMVGVEHGLADRLAVRLELYHKRLERLRPRFENLFNPLELFPEASADRVAVAPEGGRATGFEVLLRSEPGGRLDWWVSYALARAEDRIDDTWVPRAWDQRHATSFGLSWRAPRRWSLSLAGTWHSGWPTTPVVAVPVAGDGPEVEYELELGPRHSDRLPTYLRLDLRASRELATRHGPLRLYVEVLNLTNRNNLCCLDDFEAVVQPDGRVVVDRKESYWAPIVPSVGVEWTF
jgi:hypothetical protein